MKKLAMFTGAVMAALLMGSALAADLAVKAPIYKAPPPPPVYSWTGFYVGLNAGVGWGNFDPTTSMVFSPVGAFAASSVTAVNAAGPQSINPTAFTGGVQAGFNWQAGMFVLGVEGDIESFRLSGTATTTAVYPQFAPAVFTITSSANTTWLATARGRLGVAVNNWLFFVSGGAAFTNLNGAFAFNDNCGFVPACSGGGPAFNSIEAATLSGTKTGYTVGGGVEAALWGNWTAKAEYLYVNFGTVTMTGLIASPAVIAFGSNNNPFTHSLDLKANILRVGLNYKFGYGPVYAAY
jgi:outer membrane immunogenic protein